MPNGKFYQAGEVADAQLLHQPAAVGFYGLGGKIKDLCNFSTGLALNNQLEDFPLTGTELLKLAPCRGGLSLANIIVNDRLCNALTQVTLPFIDGTDSFNHLLTS